MKQIYFDLMERALSAYSNEHILRYFNDVKQNGLTEHGFPRLTSNIGILIAHGRRRDLLPIFLEMMEFCCKTIPVVDAANDFSVREIVFCLLEIEQSGAVPEEDTARWRSYLATIDPNTCYHTIARDPADDVRNWALFTALSEFFRLQAGIGGSMDFIELQIASQLKFFDENGMYMDKKKTDVHQPINYDLVPRGLFSLLLDLGYRGAHYDAVDAYLKQSALYTLAMQSPTGEMPFGGRSNQFLFNEAWMMVVYEYEAKRYAREGNGALAATFKAASARNLAVVEQWLAEPTIRHVKNRFPIESKYGCEKYAYFDKYMITVASNLYAVYQVIDDTIAFEPCEDRAPSTFATSYHFHKLFAKSGGYGIELDTNGDPEYDASGLGRVHRFGAPSAICLSLPCPVAPRYTVDVDPPTAFSLCSAIRVDGAWRLGAADGLYEILTHGTDADRAFATLRCRFDGGKSVEETYSVCKDGVEILLRSEGELGFALPAFAFDGEKQTELAIGENSLTVAYDGWLCRYETDGVIESLDRTVANRNGHYRAFVATARDTLRVKIEIVNQ